MIANAGIYILEKPNSETFGFFIQTGAEVSICPEFRGFFTSVRGKTGDCKWTGWRTPMASKACGHCSSGAFTAPGLVFLKTLPWLNSRTVLTQKSEVSRNPLIQRQIPSIDGIFCPRLVSIPEISICQGFANTFGRNLSSRQLDFTTEPTYHEKLTLYLEKSIKNTNGKEDFHIFFI